MQVKEFQEKIVEFLKQWEKKKDFSMNKEKAFTHLVEEVGELARQYVNKDMRKDKYDEGEIEDAVGDILIQVVEIAHLHGLDVEDTVLKIIREEQKFLKG